MINTDSNKYYVKALDEIKVRRNQSKLTYENHFREIERNIPEIAVINSQLAQTGKEILTVIREGKNVSEEMEKLKQSNLGAQRLIKELLRDNGYPADYLEVKYNCNKCNDTGFVGGYKCTCLLELMSSMAMQEMNNSSQIDLCDFNTFYLDMYRGNNENETQECRSIMSKIFGYCRKYADGFTTDSASIFMYGGTGLGKTHLSLSIAKEVLKKGYSVLYDSVLNYFTKVEKEHFGRGDEGEDTLSCLLGTDLLILDDLGTEYDKPIYLSTLYTIINTRLNKKLPTIISSNLDYKRMMNKYDERIISRLYASYTNLRFVGKDIRIIKNQEKNGRL